MRVVVFFSECFFPSSADVFVAGSSVCPAGVLLDVVAVLPLAPLAAVGAALIGVGGSCRFLVSPIFSCHVSIKTLYTFVSNSCADFVVRSFNTFTLAPHVHDSVGEPSWTDHVFPQNRQNVSKRMCCLECAIGSCEWMWFGWDGP